jgi:Arc/MetJ-type ribon-helix-helix transcriptional regulator
MPRNPHFRSDRTINFQVSEDMRAAIHELAKRRDMSASAVIRSAVRALLDEQLPQQPPKKAPSRTRGTSTERAEA